MNIKNKPYTTLLILACIFLLLSFFMTRQSLDIHLHDTYFIIGFKHIFWFFTLLTLVIWIMYKITNHFLFSKILTWIHIIITILALLTVVLDMLSGSNLLKPSARHYYDISNATSFKWDFKYNALFFSGIFALLFAQLFYIINFIGGLLKRIFKLQQPS
ncbi:MAG: hypothetical protein ABI402_07395 [Ferruginibacter sp.]